MTNYTDVEIYIAGSLVKELEKDFDDFGDNPDVIALFVSQDEIYDENGDYNGDGCDRLEIRKGTLYGALDGLTNGVAIKIAQNCKIISESHPDLKYMVVGAREGSVSNYDVLFVKGFNENDNPMKNYHGEFYSDIILHGL